MKQTNDVTAFLFPLPGYSGVGQSCCDRTRQSSEGGENKRKRGGGREREITSCFRCLQHYDNNVNGNEKNKYLEI